MPTLIAEDWSVHFRANMVAHVLPVLAGQPVTFLEIGIYEGRSGCFALEHLLTHPAARYLGIDTWTMFGDSIPEVRARAAANLAEWGVGPYGAGCPRGAYWHGDILGAVREFKPLAVGSVDVAYVDGWHAADACLLDLCIIWRLLRRGGLLLVDDYGTDEDRPWPGVREAVTAFAACHAGQVETIATNYQWIARKI